MRGGRGARHRDLLLHDGAGQHVAGRTAGGRDGARDLERDERAEPVVHRPRDGAAVRELDRLGGDHGDVAVAHRRPRLLAAARADVDVQLTHLGNLLALLLALEVDRLAADDPRQRALAGVHLDALADEDLRVPAADPGDAQEPLVVDVRDDQADLVDMPDDRQRRGPRDRPGDTRDDRAHDVGADVLGELARGLREHGRRRPLVAGGPGGA